MNKLKLFVLTATVFVLTFVGTMASAAMKVVDVASWQGNYQVGSYNEDGVIIKATEGVGYVNPNKDFVAKQALNQNKAYGFYHYASGGNPVNEARYFVNDVKGYLTNSNKPILWLDWEMGDNAAWGNGAWAKQFTDEVRNLTGVQPGIYTGSEGVAQTQQYLSNNTALWFAGYPTMADVGWNPIAFDALYNTGSWKTLTGWQFSSTPLDKSLFYLDRGAWNKIAGATSKPTEPTKPIVPQPGIDVKKESLEQLASYVQQGRLGNGDARKAKLGDKFEAVQIIVNERAGVISANTSHRLLAEQIVKYGRLGQGQDRVHNLGTYNNTVQGIVNSLL